MAKAPLDDVILFGVPSPLVVWYALGMSIAAVDATGEKVAMIGPYRNKTMTQKDINKVRLYVVTITSAGGSKIRVSTQGVDTANGPPYRPDGVIIGKADVLLSALTGNDINEFTLDANDTMDPGALVAVVAEFDPGGRLGADAFSIGYPDTFQATSGGTAHLTASWAAVAGLSNVALGDTASGWGKIAPGMLVKNVSTTAFKQDTATADEYGNRFIVPFKAYIGGIWIDLGVAANTSNFDLVLTASDGTVLGTISVDANTLVRATSSANWMEFYFAAEIEITSGDIYRVTIKPSQTTSTVTLPWYDVDDNAELAVMPGGVEMYQTRWLNGALVDDTPITRRPLIGPIITAIDDGAGGAGGLPPRSQFLVGGGRY